jgi:hypothetical protein
MTNEGGKALTVLAAWEVEALHRLWHYPLPTPEQDLVEALSAAGLFFPVPVRRAKGAK